MNDNLARVLETSDEEYFRQQQIRHRNKLKKKRAEKIRSGMCVLVAFMLAFAIISRFMQINELEREATAVQTSLDTLKASNDQKEVRLESTMTLSEIEEEARTRLGMNKPADNQIIYVSIDKEDATYVASN